MKGRLLSLQRAVKHTILSSPAGTSERVKGHARAELLQQIHVTKSSEAHVNANEGVWFISKVFPEWLRSEEHRSRGDSPTGCIKHEWPETDTLLETVHVCEFVPQKAIATMLLQLLIVITKVIIQTLFIAITVAIVVMVIVIIRMIVRKPC